MTKQQRPEWLQEHAEAFRAFLATAPGARLREILEWDRLTQLERAVGFLENHAYRSGWAAGFGARSESIIEFSADVRPQQDEHSSEGDGSGSAAERLAP